MVVMGCLDVAMSILAEDGDGIELLVSATTADGMSIVTGGHQSKWECVVLPKHTLVSFKSNTPQ